MPEVEDLPSLADDLELIRGVAAEAGKLALSYFGGKRDLDIHYKHGISPVTAADFAVDTYLRETLLAERPSYGWLSEETADDAVEVRMQARRTFIVDPIDGTRAFVDGHGIWCVSVAVVEDNRAIAGVLDCPALSQSYWAQSGAGSFANGIRLQVNDTGPSHPAVIGGAKTLTEELASRTGMSITHHRHVPSLAYRIAMVADGRLAGTFIKPNSHDWDIAAADIILREAGGLILEGSGTPVQLNHESGRKPAMVASRPGLGEPMLSVVASHRFG